MSDREQTEYILIFKDDSEIVVEFIQPQTYSIGRSELCDFTLNNKGISRHHATIFCKDGNLWIVDGDLKGNSSTNGLSVNHEHKELHQLNHGDLIALANDVYCLLLEPGKVTQHEPKTHALWTLLSLIPVGQNTQSQEALKTFTRNRVSEVKVVQIRDDLTNLPNRRTFVNKLNKLFFLTSAAEIKNRFAVLFIDLDGFKLVNDSLGHAAGDQLLVVLAERMKLCLRSKDTISRFGGDEFVVLINEIQSADEVMQIADRLLHSIRQPVSVNGHEIFPSASIGIASNELNYTHSDEIISDADTAMYQAKTQGKNRIEIFNTGMKDRAIQLLKLDAELRRAIEKQEFRLFYQPIVSIKKRKIVGFEALIRWQHPDRGMVPPQAFIDYLNSKELIHQVGQWVIEESCRQIHQWNSSLCLEDQLSISINLSTKQLLSHSLLMNVKHVFKSYDISPQNITFEITEEMIMNDNYQSLQIIQELRNLGVKVFIDDFGTGYSSLSYLHKFSVDGLKIDKSFIAEIDKKSERSIGFSVTQSIVTLAHNLGIKVVAEGVENAHHLYYLSASQCDLAQGYLFAKPLPSNEADKLVASGIDWIWKS